MNKHCLGESCFVKHACFQHVLECKCNIINYKIGSLLEGRRGGTSYSGLYREALPQGVPFSGWKYRRAAKTCHLGIKKDY